MRTKKNYGSILCIALMVLVATAGVVLGINPYLVVVALFIVASAFTTELKGVLYSFAVPGTPRGWLNAPNDNTARTRTFDFKEVAYAATLSLAPNASVTYFKPDQLTGALTVNLVKTKMKVLDEVIMMFDNDATQRIVTFGTDILSSGTLTIPISKTAIVRGIFDGTKLRIYSREITA